MASALKMLCEINWIGKSYREWEMNDDVGSRQTSPRVSQLMKLGPCDELCLGGLVMSDVGAKLAGGFGLLQTGLLSRAKEALHVRYPHRWLAMAALEDAR